jgi:hypothetical protein
MGFEPADDSAPNPDRICACPLEQLHRAALALQSDFLRGQLLSSLDAVLPIVLAWEELPRGIRMAIIHLVQMQAGQS